MIHSAGSAGTSKSQGRLAPLEIFALAAWCGLAGGLLEVGTRVLCHTIDTQNRMYMMSRHFIWLAPIANSLLFAGIGLVCAIVTKIRPRPGDWICPRAICFLAVLPVLMVASSRIYSIAWVILASGCAWQLAFSIERHPAGSRRVLLLSLPCLVIVVLLLAASVFGPDWLKQRRESSPPVPPSDAPHVLLIVLDTVRADRLSLYGYDRATTPNLERLAQRGIRFDNARDCAVDPPVPCGLLHRPLAARAWHQMDQSSRAKFPHLG